MEKKFVLVDELLDAFIDKCANCNSTGRLHMQDGKRLYLGLDHTANFAPLGKFEVEVIDCKECGGMGQKITYSAVRFLEFLAWASKAKKRYDENISQSIILSKKKFAQAVETKEKTLYVVENENGDQYIGQSEQEAQLKAIMAAQSSPGVALTGKIEEIDWDWLVEHGYRCIKFVGE